jgi:hypothetical protein
MKLAQRKIKWLARLMLVLLLFAQGIVAASACVGFTAGPEQAFNISQPSGEVMPCHEEKSHNANACLAHCSQADQVNVDQHHIPVLAPVGVIAWVNSQPQTEQKQPTISSQPLVLDTGPPIPIRFCSFLN